MYSLVTLVKSAKDLNEVGTVAHIYVPPRLGILNVLVRQRLGFGLSIEKVFKLKKDYIDMNLHSDRWN